MGPRALEVSGAKARVIEALAAAWRIRGPVKGLGFRVYGVCVGFRV